MQLFNLFDCNYFIAVNFFSKCVRTLHNLLAFVNRSTKSAFHSSHVNRLDSRDKNILYQQVWPGMTSESRCPSKHNTAATSSTSTHSGRVAGRRKIDSKDDLLPTAKSSHLFHPVLRRQAKTQKAFQETKSTWVFQMDTTTRRFKVTNEL